MAANKLNAHQKLKVKEIIANVFLFDGTVEIAVEHIFIAMGINISSRQVYRYLKQINEQVKKTTEQNLDKIRQNELKKLKHLELEVLGQWERSKQNIESFTTESVGVDEKELNELREDLPLKNRFDGDPRNPDADLKVKVEVKTKEKKQVTGRIAEAKYIQILVNIQERRAKLLGLDAPSKQDISITRPKPLTEMTNAELREYRESLESFKYRN